jgi:glycosyltransferase involved in cell wall biosynthesis
MTSPRTLQAWPADWAVLVPSYKAAHMLRSFLPHLLEVTPARAICVVDDASKDETPALCATLGITCISHDVNLGKGAALQTGFTRLLDKGYARILTMDADGQHAVTDIPLFIERARCNPESGLVIGNRTMKIGAMPVARIISNLTTSAILSALTGTKILDSQCGFRLYSARLLRSISLSYPRFEMESEVILKACFAGFDVSFVRVQTLYCSDYSHISHMKDTLRWCVAVVRIWRRKNQRLLSSND